MNSCSFVSLASFVFKNYLEGLGAYGGPEDPTGYVGIAPRVIRRVRPEATKKGGVTPPTSNSSQCCSRGLHELARISRGQRIKERYDLRNLLRRKLLAESVRSHL